MNEPLFALGRALATPGALDLMEATRTAPATLLARHQSGDWGDTCPEDSRANNDALVHGDRIFSVYLIAPGEKVWIITEADRSATTILLPSEYCA